MKQPTANRIIPINPSARIEAVTVLDEDDLEQLCQATDEAILDGNGFGWLTPPARRVLESYWRGVMLVPERELFIARLDGHIVGSAQLLKPPPNNEAGAHAATMSTFFIAPWARGHGLAKGLLKEVEQEARNCGFRILDLDVRATQLAAIHLYEEAGFERWATKTRYALVDGQYVPGHYYSKVLRPDSELPGAKS